jgi:hypothetical protein
MTGAVQMPRGQQPRITTTIVEHFEAITDRITAVFANGVVTPEDSREIIDLIEKGHQTAMQADEGIRLGVALIRGGTGSTHVRRYAADRNLVEALTS